MQIFLFLLKMIFVSCYQLPPLTVTVTATATAFTARPRLLNRPLYNNENKFIRLAESDSALGPRRILIVSEGSEISASSFFWSKCLCEGPLVSLIPQPSVTNICEREYSGRSLEELFEHLDEDNDTTPTIRSSSSSDITLVYLSGLANEEISQIMLDVNNIPSSTFAPPAFAKFVKPALCKQADSLFLEILDDHKNVLRNVASESFEEKKNGIFDFVKNAFQLGEKFGQ